MISRALSVSRVHTVAWPLLVAWPVGILAVAFAIPWAIFAIVQPDETNYTGSVTALLGVALTFYIGAMTQTFPFALGMSVTRRDYFASTLVVGLAQVVGFGVMLWALAGIETATHGWGVNMVMFGIPNIFTSNPLVQLGAWFAVLALIAGIGLFVGALYRRWRVTGLYSVGAGLLVLAGLAAIVITWQGGWPAFGSWFADEPRVVTMVALPAVLAAAFTFGAWRLIRRAPA
ncbi:MAG: ABC transporter permease [Rhodococcus sp.]|nr:ABC transporter permease [Rhodococcus sp. (in: high G+C Gram-positive bacteria)]